MTTAVCSKCDMEKPFELFKKDKRKLSGYSTICKSCASQASIEYRSARIEERLVKEAEYRARERERLRQKYRDNIEYHRRYYQENKEAFAERCRDSRERNRGAFNERAARRRVAKRSATLPLPDHAVQQIRVLYEEAARLSIETGVLHHVDHIMPLQGSNSCGLHVPWNLRVIPAVENLSKGNAVIPELMTINVKGVGHEPIR